MKRSSLALLVPLLAVLAAAGCGGSGTYSLAKTRSCLVRDRVRVVAIRPREDFVASTATNGALRAIFPKNEVTISFGQDAQEATRIADAYRRFHGSNIGINDVLDAQSNVVLLWALHPAEHDLTVVHDCLS